ncbi:MAG TPA: phage Gp37/Gp68 family protein, partial [Aquabacterium sp.]|nr:phage Gp37/Gp68 family protein [Aquabacterium sp.]
MSENTKIEWCDHTFNPWEGCQKVGPGCDHCYAETRNARFSGGQAINWGPGAPRRRTSAGNWAKPLKWQANAAAFQSEHGRRQRVFCASLADVFDNAVPPEWRLDLFKLIAETPDLDWLLLTKRIGNVPAMLGDYRTVPLVPNIWIGATITSQAEADRDIPKLLAVPARVRFLSMEPLLGPVSFEGMFANQNDVRDHTNMLEELAWVIVGGESGPGARPMSPN